MRVLSPAKVMEPRPMRIQVLVLSRAMPPVLCWQPSSRSPQFYPCLLWKCLMFDAITVSPLSQQSTQNILF